MQITIKIFMKFDNGNLPITNVVYKQQLVTTEFYLSENKKEIIR